jgi:hypothetical protein
MEEASVIVVARICPVAILSAVAVPFSSGRPGSLVALAKYQMSGSSEVDCLCQISL